MPKTKKLIIACTFAFLATACPTVDDEPSDPIAPDPIGAELLSIVAPGGLETCRRVHLYRDGRALQYQCLTYDGVFSWENRATLSPAGAEALDAALAGADLDNTEPADDNGWCGNIDTKNVTLTVWVGERSVEYEFACPSKGWASLDEFLLNLDEEVGGCDELELIESFEPGCRFI